MGYAAKILADSRGPDGIRLTTFEVTFPRFILAEVNTHRMLSRNSASSRAIPTEKQIERVRKEPFVPVTFNLRVKGMGVGGALEEQDLCRTVWLTARDRAVEAAIVLNEIGVDKSRVNRLLEPFMWHTAIISATEWDNFFALRDHEAAQPEFQVIASMMHSMYDEGTPRSVRYDEWHTPLVRWSEAVHADGVPNWEVLKSLSASRCARVSFDKHTDNEPLADTLDRAQRLMTSVPAHLSPFEHVARPIDLGEGVFDPDAGTVFVGNFRGWFQMRKEIPNESNARLMIEAAA